MGCAGCRYWDHKERGMGKCSKYSGERVVGEWGRYNIEQWRDGKRIDPPDTEIRTLEYDSCSGCAAPQDEVI